MAPWGGATRVPSAVLRQRRAEMRGDHQERRRRALRREAVGGQPAQENEAGPVLQPVRRIPQHRAEMGQGRVLRPLRRMPPRAATAASSSAAASPPTGSIQWEGSMVAPVQTPGPARGARRGGMTIRPP